MLTVNMIVIVENFMKYGCEQIETNINSTAKLTDNTIWIYHDT